MSSVIVAALPLRDRMTIALCFAVIILACSFIFCMMQMSAITYPYWDHWADAEIIVTYYDHGLSAAVWQAITGLSQHTRPAVLRLIFLFNAILTRWDVSSEYIFVYAAIFSGLALHLHIIRRMARTPRIGASEAILMAAVTVLFLSPANHNNHWWSYMLQLNLNSAFSVLAIYLIAFHPREWWANVLAAVLCWMSVYTLTNGLFLIIALPIIVQIAKKEARPDLFIAFWLINIVLVFWSYFPIHENGMSARPSLVSVIHFTLMYIGQPIAALLQFNYHDAWEPPAYSSLSTIVGLLVIAFTAYVLFNYRYEFLRPSPQLLFLVGSLLYVGLSAAGTGWARVTFDSFGIRNGNSSRYVITGTLLTIALLYFCFAERHSFLKVVSLGAARAPSGPLVTASIKFIMVAFIACSAITYFHSISLYARVAAFNRMLSGGFSRDAKVTQFDPYLYPGQEKLNRMRSDLLRLRIGPYRGEPSP